MARAGRDLLLPVMKPKTARAGMFPLRDDNQAIIGRSTEAGGVAYLAHIAGCVAGAALILIFHHRNPRFA